MIWYMKLWYWWNFTIKRDNFHYKLSSSFLYDKFSSLEHSNINDIITRQRDIAHRLDLGTSIREIAPKEIKLAEI